MSVALLGAAGCQSFRAEATLQRADELIYTGHTNEALNALAGIPWNSGAAFAARSLMGQLSTRIDGGSDDARAPHQDLYIARRVGVLPHEQACATEGLEFDHGSLLESCGEYGQARLQRIDATTGDVLRAVKLDDGFFLEGITAFHGTMFVLTWLGHAVLPFTADLLPMPIHLSVSGEGWGLTHDDTRLIYSDGSNIIRFLDPATGAVTKSLAVVNGTVPVMNINELEFVNGKILANIWLTDRIARIDPETGIVDGWILADTLVPGTGPAGPRELNGIAYDPAGDLYYLTGKSWPSIFVVKLQPIN